MTIPERVAVALWRVRHTADCDDLFMAALVDELRRLYAAAGERCPDVLMQSEPCDDPASMVQEV